MHHHYNPPVIEPKWQAYWDTHQVFRTPTDPAILAQKPKFYILDMFPYPSAAGLHVGHPEGYTATDVVARLKRMQGFNVLHPMGWDAFGLPTERAAVRENRHPAEISKENIDNFRRQIQRLGFSYDWSREINTADPDYYRWTQWIFLKLYERGLAYLAEVPVNWCPALGTVLANEEVKEGKYVETGDVVERRLMKQWMLKITAYAERLLEDLESVDWPDGVKEMQRNWIGKSLGAEIHFAIEGRAETFTVFTTRPDTLFGCTYCVLAPEHPLVRAITTDAQRAAVDTYVTTARNKSDLQRTDLAKEKTGVFTGAYAVHPVTNVKIPVWIADYVLAGYGTGAVMAVPAHDTRDHAFAKTFALPIAQVIDGTAQPIEDCAHEGDGTLINSDFLNGCKVDAAKLKMIAWLEAEKKGTQKIQYRLRDWLFSRQRYWGEPFPMIRLENGEVRALPDDALPVELPMLTDFRPTDDGQPPLARASTAWMNVTLPDGTRGTRETNTMPQWAGSCWYYLRYIDPKNSQAAWSSELEKYWMPVDLYIGGVEHAVLHLLYARFWHKVLYDCGLVHTKEPFQKLFNQGMILAFSYRDARGKYFHPSDTEIRDGLAVLKTTGEALETQIEKMSKSKQNVVSPDDVIDQYGADTLRLYELFMGPLDQPKPWQMDGVEGLHRFLARIWRLFVDDRTGTIRDALQPVAPTHTPELWKLWHQTLAKVTSDTLALQFNTAISQCMIFLNAAQTSEIFPREIAVQFVRALAPYAPHLAEELWERLGEIACVAQASWPVYDPNIAAENEVTIVVQVNGKRRDSVNVARDADEATVLAAVRTEKVVSALEGKSIVKTIHVPGRLVNFVVK